MNTTREEQIGTALVTAILSGDTLAARRLFGMVEVSSEVLGKILIQVCLRADFEMVELLIAKGANIHEEEGEAIKYAVFNGDTAILRLLIENGATLHEIVLKGLHIACTYCKDEILEFILTSALDMLTYGNVSQYERDRFMTEVNQSLFAAIPAPCTENSSRTISLLLDRGGADPNYVDALMNVSVFGLASVSDKIDIMRILLEYGAEPNINNGEALTMAVNANKVRAVRFLLTDANMDYGVRTRALRLAEEKGHTEIASLLTDSV